MKKSTGRTSQKKSKFNKAGFRSGLETKASLQLTELLGDKGWGYETEKLRYVRPSTKHVYTPDFHIKKTNTYVEVKGKLDIATRQKMLWVKQQNPHATIIMCFGKPANKLYRGSKTTYADWCDKNGFLWCDTETLYLHIEKSRL